MATLSVVVTEYKLMTNQITNQTILGYPFSSVERLLPTHFQLKWSAGSKPVINVPFNTEYQKVKAGKQGEVYSCESWSDYVSGGYGCGIVFNNVDISTKFRDDNSSGLDSIFKGSNPIINLKGGDKTIALFEGNRAKEFAGKVGRFIPTSNGGGQGITIIFL